MAKKTKKKAPTATTNKPSRSTKIAISTAFGLALGGLVAGSTALIRNKMASSAAASRFEGCQKGVRALVLDLLHVEAASSDLNNFCEGVLGPKE